MKDINFLKGIKEGQKMFTETISIIINTILLTFVYFFGVGITSIIGKIFNKKFLDKKINTKLETYWESPEKLQTKMEDYYKQF